MEKTELMYSFEQETGEEALVIVPIKGDSLTVVSEEYTRWCEEQYKKAQFKAAAYDRLMSGEPKHCPFCHGEIKPIDHPPFWMAINGSQIDVYVDGLGAMATTINYCPMCGRRLTMPDGWEEK